MSWVPCPSCARHVRHDAEQCPFCGAPLTPTRDEASDRIELMSMVLAYGIPPGGPELAPRRWPFVLAAALLIVGALLYALGRG